jgi:hypothetical protein
MLCLTTRRRTTTALSIRDREDNVVFDNAMMTQHGLNYGLTDIEGFLPPSVNDQSESQNSDASVYLKLWYCPYIRVEYHRLHENNLAQKRQLK